MKNNNPKRDITIKTRKRVTAFSAIMEALRGIPPEQRKVVVASVAIVEGILR